MAEALELSQQIANEAANLRAQIVSANKELELLEQEANSITEKRRNIRVAREALSKHLDSLGVQHTVATNVEATAKARTEAEQFRAELSALKAETEKTIAEQTALLADKHAAADALLAKAKEAAKE